MTTTIEEVIKEKWRLFFIEMCAARERLEAGKLIPAYQALIRAFEYASELRKET